MSEIILSDNNNNILEYVEVINPTKGVLDANHDMLLISDNNPVLPNTEQSTYEIIAHKVNHIIDTGNTINYPTIKAVVDYINDTQSGISGITITESQVIGLIDDLASKSNTGHTHTDYTLQTEYTSHTGDTSIHFAQSAITITESQVTGLINDLANKSNTGHTHNQYGLQEDLVSHTGDTSIHYQQSGITITESQVTGLIDDLQNRSLTGHTHDYSEIQNTPDLNLFATNDDLTGHTNNTSIHFPQSGITINESQVTNLVGDLASKSNTGHTHTGYTLQTEFISHTDDTSIHFPQSGITSVGIITGGTWQGNLISANYISGLTTGTTVLLNSGQILVGNASNVPTAVTPTGDATISNTGVISVNKTRLIVRNESGTSILTTKPVYVNGFNNYPLIRLTDNTDKTKHNVIGLTVGNIGDQNNGYIATGGQCDAETNSWAVGTELYMGTGGTLTSIEPVNGAVIHVGIVTVQENYPQGKILIFIQPEGSVNARGLNANMIIRAGDNTGGTKTSFRRYDNTEVGYIDTLGNLNFEGTLKKNGVDILATKTNQSEFTGHTENTSIHFVQSAITISESQVTNLVDDLASKSNTGHTHTGFTDNINFSSHTGDTSIHFAQSAITITENQVTNLVDDLASKSNTGHTHNDFISHTGDTSIHFQQSGITITESQVSGLVSDLASKSNTGHTHSDYTLTNDFSSHTGDTSIHFAQSAITITESQVTGLVDDLASKSNTGHTHNNSTLNNIILSGTSIAPTPITNTDNTEIATTAFVNHNNAILSTLSKMNSLIKVLPLGYSFGGGSSIALTDGTIYFITLNPVASGTTVTGIKCQNVTQGVFTGDTFNGCALYSFSGTSLVLVAQSASDESKFKSSVSSTLTFPFSGGTYIMNDGMYMAAVLYNSSTATTAPGLYSAYTLTGNVLTSFFGTTTGRISCQLASQSSMPTTISIGSVSANSSPPLLALY